MRPVARAHIYSLVDQERSRQELKFPGRSVSSASLPDLAKLRVLVEEVGEVAEAMDEEANTRRELVAELVQVAACAVGWLESLDRAETLPTRPYLIGECNPHGSDPAYALFPKPKGAAGDRLRAIMGITSTQYLRLFRRANLCPQAWSIRAARARAAGIKSECLDGKPRTFVLLGQRVARAFAGVADWRPFTAETVSGPWTYVFLPHPSGRCRMWNEDGAAERARGVLREVGALPTE